MTILKAFMRAMAEAARILLIRCWENISRVNDRKVLDAAYSAEIKVVEPRLVIKPEALRGILDDVAQIGPRAKKVKPEDLVHRRYLGEMETSGFFDKLWAKKRDRQQVNVALTGRVA